MWLQHTFTDRRNHEIEGERVYYHAYKMLDFTGKTIVQKYIFPSATLA